MTFCGIPGLIKEERHALPTTAKRNVPGRSRTNDSPEWWSADEEFESMPGTVEGGDLGRAQLAERYFSDLLSLSLSLSLSSSFSLSIFFLCISLSLSLLFSLSLTRLSLGSLALSLSHSVNLCFYHSGAGDHKKGIGQRLKNSIFGSKKRLNG